MAAGGHPPEGPPEENDDDDDAAPSELLGPLLEEWRDVLVKHVLSRLDPNDIALLARVGKPWLAVVVANNLPRAGKSEGVPLKSMSFAGPSRCWLGRRTTGARGRRRRVHSPLRAGSWRC